MANNELHLRPQEFRAALDYTAAETGFSARLIEKDYWCSLILRGLFLDLDTPLVFKGGTLLSKAFAGFDRLSEDLDFAISTSTEVGRAARSRNAAKIEARLKAVASNLGLQWAEPWTGHNGSTQHGGRLSYPAARGSRENILIEVSQRETLMTEAVKVPLNTLLLNPLFAEPVLPPVTAIALSRKEAYAEKTRAALTRDEPAIRDLYDLLQGRRAGFVPLEDAAWMSMVRQKCTGLDLSSACSPSRHERFRIGVETDLLPVLRSGAAAQFKIAEAWKIVETIQAKLLAT